MLPCARLSAIKSIHNAPGDEPEAFASHIAHAVARQQRGQRLGLDFGRMGHLIPARRRRRSLAGHPAYSH